MDANLGFVHGALLKKLFREVVSQERKNAWRRQPKNGCLLLLQTDMA